MLLNLNSRSHLPLWEQIIAQIKELIVKRVLAPGDRLPPVRELSSQLLVNPNTVAKAYKELERLGLTETFRGKGTFIAEGQVQGPVTTEIEKLKDNLKQTMIEATYQGIAKEEFKEWVEDLFKEIRGDQGVKSEKPEKID